MKTAKYVLLLLMLSSGLLFAQFEDELPGDDEDQEVEEICIPENLFTGWDTSFTEKPEQSIGLLYNFGYEYYKNKSYKEALPYLWQVFIHGNEKFKKNSIRKITTIYFTQGLVDSTMMACYRGLEIFPDEKSLHHYAGLLQNKLGKFRCAIPHFEAMARLESENLDYLKTLSILYFKNEDERSIEVQEKIVELDKESAEEKNTLARYVSYFRGEGADLEYRKKAYEQDPENIEFAFSYAEVAASAGNFKEALPPFNKVISKNPSSRAYIARAKVYENLGQNNNAINDLKEVIKLEPDNVNIMLRVAENYRINNNFSSAKYWVNKTLQKKRGYGNAYISMGLIYEAAVSYCLDKKKDGKLVFEDKLVYELAAKEYIKAKKDPLSARAAKTKHNNVIPFLPTKEDRFMHKNDKIKSPCYTSWIK